MSERSFSQDARALVVAHRGASATEPENTLAAFEAAISAGADVVEFDVRMTADGIAVVMHDADVERTTGGAGLVRDLSLAEVKRLRIAGSAEVPSLEETLRCCSGRIAVDVEIKNIPGEPDFDAERELAVEATLRTLDEVGFSGVVLVSSFNPFSIARSLALAPDVPTGLLSDPTVEARAALGYAHEQGHPWVLPFVNQVLSTGPGPVSEFADEAHAAGMRLGTWLVDDPAESVELFRAGIDAVATNDPASAVIARTEAGLA